MQPSSYRPSLTCARVCAAIVTLCVASTCLAQIPERITVDLHLDFSRITQPSHVFDGASTQHNITIRWYDQPVGGHAVQSERFRADIKDDRLPLELGATADIPHTLLAAGNAWLGITIDDAPELQPRTMLVAVPYAQYSQHASVADRLSGNTTDVVTSLNEVAGAVKVLGERGIVVRQEGDALLIGADTTLAMPSLRVESGVIRGNNTHHTYSIHPKTKISLSSCVTAFVVSPTTTITCGIASIDVSNNMITVITSAALTAEESIHWQVSQRQ